MGCPKLTYYQTPTCTDTIGEQPELKAVGSEKELTLINTAQKARREYHDEIKGEGNSYTTQFRQYDPRIGRWLTMDPLAAKYPFFSPYIGFENNPIYIIDPKGLEGEPSNGSTEITESNLDVDKPVFWTKEMIENSSFAQKYNVEAGSLKSFEKDGKTYKNTYSTKTKEFLGYSQKDTETGQREYFNPQLKTTDGSDDSDASMNPLGPVLIVLGTPIESLKPVGALGSRPGSSIASKTLSKAFPQNITKTFGKNKATTWIAKKSGTKVAGRIVGRFVPVVGWALFLYDFGDISYKLIKEGYEIQKSGGSTAEKFRPNSAKVCVLDGTEVLTPKGMSKIEDLVVGDSIYSYNFALNQYEVVPINELTKGGLSQHVRVTLNTGVIMLFSKAHQLYLDDGSIVTAENIVPGMSLLTLKNKEVKMVEVMQVENVKENRRSYNIRCKNDCYIISGDEVIVMGIIDGYEIKANNE